MSTRSTDHPHFCDCDECLNRGARLVIPGAGATVVEPELHPEQRNHNSRAEYAAALRRYYAAAKARSR